MNKRLLLNTGIFALAAIAGLGCSSSQPPAQQQEQAINVLMVTATMGERNEASIARAKEIFSQLDETTGLDVDMTDDHTHINAANLQQYDVLFLNNATLSGAPERADRLAGRWNLTVPLDTMEQAALLTVIGETGTQQSGILRVGPAAETELENVSYDGSTITFTWGRGRRFGGEASVQLSVSGQNISGTLTGTDNSTGQITGTRAEGPYVLPPAGTFVSDEQKQAIVDFVSAGKGLVVAHDALSAFMEWPEYREIVGGGLVDSSAWTQQVRIIVEEENPATSHLGEAFLIRDEILALDRNPRWNSRVLLSLDNESVGVLQGPSSDASNDFPLSWIREYNEGRVFVTALGGQENVWSDMAFRQHLLQGIRMAAGDIAADFSGRLVKDVIADDVWPDDIAVDERGNIWIAELSGGVHLYDNATGQVRHLVTLNTTDPTNIEHGLMGIEVDPNFYNGEPWVYLFYTDPEKITNTLWRYQYRNNQLDMSTGEVILHVPTEPHCCHQAGDLEWGPDGTLYLSTGDTGQSNTRPSLWLSEEEIQTFVERNGLEAYHWSRLVDSEHTSQNLQSLRGKILRINKDGSIPKDNPFFGQPGVRWEIYAYGLRNPYRFKVDPITEAVYIGVVGPDEDVTYDEYNIALRGGENFGWPRDNGLLLYNEWKPEMIPNYTPSAWEYPYDFGGRSAGVGPIYRSDGEYALPQVFQNKLFVWDYSRRWIKWAEVEDGTWTNNDEWSTKEEDYSVSIPTPRLTNIKTFDVFTTGGRSPISMELAPDGSLILAEFAGFWTAGEGARVTRYRWVTDEDTPVQDGIDVEND
jgi:cytochrome c